MGSNSPIVPYNYGGVGGGVGFGLPIPVTGSVSMAQFPSTGGEVGRLYILPKALASSDVTIDSISGPAVLVEPNISLFGVGGSLSFILFGAMLSDLTGGLGSVTSLFRGGAKAIAFQASGSVITPAFGVGFTGCQLNIFNYGKMQKAW
jgi:hypothetical protein